MLHSKTVAEDKLRKRITLHESGHHFGLEHPTYQSIMDLITAGFDNDDTHAVFAEQELGRIQAQPKPVGISGDC